MDGKITPQIGDSLSTLQAMQLAIREAWKGAPFVSPNPRVGCVVLDKNGKLLATGFHQKFGENHAEANAIKNLSADQLQHAHVIVTLEPCAHEGKTPSCAKTLITFPIAKVTYGLIDPNPLVAGQGADILKAKGIQVEEFKNLDGISEQEKQATLDDLEEVCEAFLTNLRDKRVFVGLKLATSLDGALALKNGDSKWITGPEARQQGHYLRGCYDLTLVGSETVLADNPSLNVRDQSFAKENKVGVLDGQARCLKKLSELNLLKTHKPESLYFFVEENSVDMVTTSMAKELGVHVVALPRKNNSFSWSDIFSKLWGLGVRSVLVEGGAKVSSSLLSENRVDRLHVFQAPVLLGQKTSRLWNSELEVSTMDQRAQVKPIKITHLGQDLYLTGLVKRK